MPREEIFVTTKIWNDSQGPDAARAYEESLQKLGLDYVDLYLIHSPISGKENRLGTWRALVEKRDEGKVRSIGVSN